MQGQDEVNNVDDSLLLQFEQEVQSKVPHLREEPGAGKAAAIIINATPLVDITKDLKECAKNVFGLDLADKALRVFGKFDSDLLAGSIKVRPAVQIIHDAIATGKLKRGQTIFEATSGNFGIALGQISKLGIDVVALVSRKLQEGVFDELRNEKTRIINLDMDICPAPGMKGNANLMAARATASNVRAQLTELGFDPAIFDKSRSEVEAILASQDIINLAKLLARIYGGFCPEQYDNELNIEAHRTVTAAELDQQLREQGNALSESRIVCTFGTGGTSGGLSRYMMEKYGKKSVHVVFPLGDQDVAGIRTKGKAAGLKFYEPDRYAGQHEVDFRQAKRLLKFFVDKGYDMGESSALALYAVIQMANFGMGGSNFVVMIADGIQKYRKSLEAMAGEEKQQRSLQVPLQEAVSNIGNYDRVVWIHTMYTPRKEGIELIAKSLGVDESKIFVPTAREVEQLLATQQVPKEMEKSLGGANAKPLLVCMMGNTSLRVAEVLAQKGIVAESLNGGISALSAGKGKQIPELVRMATE
ncbi:pyridoxal-phosphate dependent enzyme [Nitrososphaera viennensis]|uniref:Pyridoxal-phosphate dependent enzyme n=2 Tax=Nitrososphaera viennensis TaxID=1034015 RepID=A0A977IBX4_9ARCH|nr:pyridoxal-phosphate dependent enzyme [Nitrososphaera viennensis]AIC16006.1 putative cysteine synthase [Nitrososphaera viennensis EN76]UVS67980.1 pyridoxal-phosphate dependent enzyme [Nitrososphaera viennensis]